MVLVVSLLVEPFAAVLADERFYALVDPHVRVEGRRSVKGLATRATNVRFLRSVDDLVATERRRLPKPFITNLQAQLQNQLSPTLSPPPLPLPSFIQAQHERLGGVVVKERSQVK